MIDPSWLADILAGLVLAIAVYCLGRIGFALVRARRVELDADLTHILMGIGMAGMFVTRLAILDTAVWATVFGVVAAWFLLRIALPGGHDAGRRAGLRHHAGHLLSALAMLYMFLAIPSTSSAGPMSSMGAASMGSGMGTAAGMGAHLPTLALLFAVLLFVYVVLVADRIPLTATVGAAAGVGELGDGVGDGPFWRRGLGVGPGTLLAPARRGTV